MVSLGRIKDLLGRPYLRDKNTELPLGERG